MRTYFGIRLAAVGVVCGACTLALAQQKLEVKPLPMPATQPAVTTQPAATQPTSGPASHLELSANDFDFGEVWEGAPVKREFGIKNTGEAPLILDVKSSCGCTVATKPKSPLEVGESTTFSVTYDTKHIGPAAKQLTISSNDPAQPSVIVKVHGTVKPVFEINPQTGALFRGLEVTSAKSETLKVTNKYDRPLNLKIKEGQDFGRFDVVLNEIKPGMEYELVATTKPPLQMGSNRAVVLLETGFVESPTVTVRLDATVQPRVSVTPSPVYVVPQQVQSTTRTLLLQHREDNPVKITDIKSSLESIKWELKEPTTAPGQPQQQTATFQILVTLPPYSEIPEDGAKLEIFTDDASEEYRRLEVPILRRTPLSMPARSTQPSSGPTAKPANPAGVSAE